MKISFLLCLLFIFFACKNKQEIITFPKKINVNCEVIPNSPFMGLPLSLNSYKNKLFITDFYGDKLIMIFDVKKNRKTGEIAPKGKGPKEFLSPLLSEVSESVLYVLNKANYHMGKFNLEGGPSDTLYSFTDLFTVPNSIIRMIPIKKLGFVASGYFLEGRYAIIDSLGVIKNYFGTYPEYLENEATRPFEARAMFHQCRFTSNPSKKLLATASNQVLDIWDYSSLVPKSKIRILLSAYDYIFTSGQILTADASNTTSKGVCSICSTESFIYLVFNPNNQKSEEKMNEIWVFDWKGNPVKKIIPNMNIDLIESIDDSVIYGVAMNPAPVLVKMMISND